MHSRSQLGFADPSIDTRSGFTLIEVTAACVLLVLLAGVGVVSLQSRISATRLTQALERIENADRAARAMARNGVPGVQLQFSTQDGEVRVMVGKRAAKVMKLPSGVQLTSLRLSNRRGREQTTLNVSRLGQTPSFAAELSLGESRRFLIVTGLSGQTVRTTKPEQVNALLRL